MAKGRRLEAGEGDYVPGEAKREYDRPGQNYGDPRDPLAADGIGIATAENVPAMRLVMYRGLTPTAHVSLAIEGMEAFAYDLLECIAEARKLHKLAGPPQN
jgi:hypothetical protein